MRFVLLIPVFALMAFASGITTEAATEDIFPDINGIVDNHPYDHAQASNTMLGSYNGWVVVDDFTGNCIISTYTCWATAVSSQPETLTFVVVSDASGKPSGEPISMNTYPCKTYDTGYMYGTKTLWRAVIDLSSKPITVDGTVWLGSYREGSDEWFLAVSDTVIDGMVHIAQSDKWKWKKSDSYANLGPCELYRVIEEADSALETTTWAGIKNLF